MELVKYMDMDTLVDSRGCEKLVNQLIEYDQRLYKDALTGVYNRRYFEEQIKKKNENAGVAVIDMDDFKLCNDTLGHSVGDAALRTMVKTVKHCIRKTDILIRYGGDEFILILEKNKKEIFSINWSRSRVISMLQTYRDFKASAFGQYRRSDILKRDGRACSYAGR